MSHFAGIDTRASFMLRAKPLVLRPLANFDQITAAVAEWFGIPIGELVGASRLHRVADARHVAMFLFRSAGRASLCEIGIRFGRDHTTVMVAVQKVERSELRAHAEAIWHRLEQSR